MLRKQTCFNMSLFLIHNILNIQLCNIEQQIKSDSASIELNKIQSILN